MSRRVYLGLGANLGDRLANLREGLRLLPPAVGELAVSPLYETEPVGVTDQPPFLNAVCLAETDLEPEDLLDHLKWIERSMGRVPGPIWGPRPLDLDILLYGDAIVETDRLRIPHARLAERAFVLVPLATLCPTLIVPDIGRTVSDLRDAADQRGVRWVAEPEWASVTLP